MIGDEKFKHYVILGQAVHDVKAAEHVSVSGDIVVSPTAWGHVAEENYDATFADGGNVKVQIESLQIVRFLPFFKHYAQYVNCSSSAIFSI